MSPHVKFTLDLARNNPTTNYLGLELREVFVQHALEQMVNYVARVYDILFSCVYHNVPNLNEFECVLFRKNK